MVATKSHKPRPEHDAFMKAMKETMPPEMPAQEILAITAQFLGQLIALQDQRNMTPDMAMQIVSENIEIGNQAALLSLMDTAGEA